MTQANRHRSLTLPRVYAGVLLVVIAAAMGATLTMLGDLPGSQGAGIEVAAGNALMLQVRRDGSVQKVVVSGSELRILSRPSGFSVRPVGGMPNLLPNAGFERDQDGDHVPDGWRLVGRGAQPQLTRAVAHSGRRSVRISNPHRAISAEIVATVPVRPDRDYTLSAWFRSNRLLPTAPTALTPSAESPLRVKIQQLSQAGQLLTTTNVFGYTNTAPWNHQFGGFHTLRRTRRVNVVGMIVRGSGTVWLDDLYLGELLQRHVIPARGEVSTNHDGVLQQRAEFPREDLELAASYQAVGGGIVVRGSVRTTSPRDIPFQLTYTLPVDAGGWWWDDYVRHARRIRSGVYDYLTRWDTFGASRYPYGEIHNRRAELMLALPPQQPRIARFQYDVRHGLSVTFDLGVSPHALGGKASFSFAISTADPGWGFRSATARYYRLFPAAFRRRIPRAREGMWYAQPDLRALDDPSTARDESTVFGLGLNMLPLAQLSPSTPRPHYLPWDARHHVIASAYNQHWTFHHPQKASATVPTYGRVTAMLKREADTSQSGRVARLERMKAQAGLASTARDVNGRLLYEMYTRPQTVNGVPQPGQWLRFLSFYENLDPAPRGTINWARFAFLTQTLEAVRLAAREHARLGAIHMDSTSGVRRWAAAEDYDRSHWKSATMPLTFSPTTGLVTDLVEFSDYSHLRQLARYLHHHGMILSANFNGSEARAGSWFGMDVVDYFGVEQALEDKAGEADPYVSVDSFAMFKRSLAYQRPISVIDDKVGSGDISLAADEQRMKRSLFYDIFMGVRGNYLTAGPLATPAGRALYAEYTPIFKHLASAGWQPVTDARSSNRRVWVERYGSLSGGDLYLTLRNETTTQQRYTLTLDLRSLASCAVKSLRATDQIRGTTFAVRLGSGGNRATVTGMISAMDTDVIGLASTGRRDCPT